MVLAASCEAKVCGVRSPMNGRDALRLCPDATVMRPRFDANTEASRVVFEIVHDTTPLVEGISLHEAFLDVAAGDELSFLHPLPVERPWGVGAVTSRKLRDAGISTVGDLAAVGEVSLGSLLGRASGPAPLRAGTGAGSATGPGGHAASVDRLAASAGPPAEVPGRSGSDDGGHRRPSRQAVVQGRKGLSHSHIALAIDDFTPATRSRTLHEPTMSTQVLMTAVRGLLDDALPIIRGKGCTLIGLSLTNLDSSIQMALPFEEHHHEKLDITIDG